MVSLRQRRGVPPGIAGRLPRTRSIDHVGDGAAQLLPAELRTGGTPMREPGPEAGALRAR